MHVLVAVASRHGSTREIADAIAQDWSAIRGWADGIGAALKSAATADTAPDSPSQSPQASYFG